MSLFLSGGDFERWPLQDGRGRSHDDPIFKVSLQCCTLLPAASALQLGGTPVLAAVSRPNATGHEVARGLVRSPAPPTRAPSEPPLGTLMDGTRSPAVHVTAL